MKRWIIVVIVVVVLAGGFYIFTQYRARQASASSEYQTVPAERGNLTATIGATGVVHAKQTALLAWQTSGIVRDVNVMVKDQASTGQVLAELEQTSLAQNVILAQADLVNAQKTLDDLLNSNVQKAKASQTVDNAQKALDDARDPELSQAKAQEAIANAQKAVDDAELALRWAKSPASQSLIDDAQAQVVIVKDRLDKAKEKYAPYENKPEDNLTRASLLSQLSLAQQQYDAAVRKLNGLQGSSGPTDIAVKEADLATAKAQLEQAKRDWERLKDGPNPADIALLEAQLEDARREYERLKNGADPNDIAAAQARIAAAQATINQAQITAPFDGVITDISIKPGDQTTPGTVAFRLDDLSHLLVDVQVSEVDINRIQAGQDVVLTFDAISNKEYHGKVSEVAPVGTSTQGVVDFTVTVELTDADEAVKPGMTAAVNIVVSQLSDVLLVPNRAVRVQNGKRVVYILNNGNLSTVEITLGASSDTNSEVLDGNLKVGDLIALNPPLTFDSNGPPPFVNR
jgi:HlyD family secretion protein